MGRALVLNATDAPLAVVPARRAVVLVLKDKAEVVLSNGMVFHSERIVMEAPSVVRLRRYVRVPYRPHAPLTRRAVFARDTWALPVLRRHRREPRPRGPDARGAASTPGRTSWPRAGAATPRRKTARPPRPASTWRTSRSPPRRVPPHPRPSRTRLGGLPPLGPPGAASGSSGATVPDLGRSAPADGRTADGRIHWARTAVRARSPVDGVE